MKCVMRNDDYKTDPVTLGLSRHGFISHTQKNQPKTNHTQKKNYH